MGSLARGVATVAVAWLPLLALTADGAPRAATRPIAENRSTARPAGPLIVRTPCPAFPADNVWNTPITGLPVDSRSVVWLAHMAARSTFLHPDFGPSGGRTPYGIPWQIAPAAARLVRVRFQYADQSDRGPYPLSAGTPIEGGASATGDRHALMVDPRRCVLYELYDARFRPHGRSTAGSGAIWRLDSNRLRPSGWTSADAAGLPILPGLVNYEEVKSGHIDHAIRFTAQTTDTAYRWPARHQAGSVANAEYPPMGARFRLSPRFSLPASKCARPCQVVLVAMQRYGLILADNGSNWYFQGTADRRWTYAIVDQLKQIPATAFAAVDESCLIVNRNSGQALQPGTAAYDDACGSVTPPTRTSAAAMHNVFVPNARARQK